MVIAFVDFFRKVFNKEENAMIILLQKHKLLVLALVVAIAVIYAYFAWTHVFALLFTATSITAQS